MHFKLTLLHWYISNCEFWWWGRWRGEFHWEQARKLGRCNSYLRNLKLSLTDPLSRQKTYFSALHIAHSKTDKSLYGLRRPLLTQQQLHLMYSGKRWWGEWDIRQGSRIPLAPPSSQMVASLQGHYSCITAYVSRVHFIYAALYTEYMQQYTNTYTAYTAFTERHMPALLLLGWRRLLICCEGCYQLPDDTAQLEYWSLIMQMYQRRRLWTPRPVHPHSTLC